MADDRFYRNPFSPDDADRVRAGSPMPTVERSNSRLVMDVAGRLVSVPEHASTCPWRFGKWEAGSLVFGTCNCRDDAPAA